MSAAWKFKRKLANSMQRLRMMKSDHERLINCEEQYIYDNGGFAA